MLLEQYIGERGMGQGQGMGMGRGQGMGQGMGRGRGMGQGMGQGMGRGRGIVRSDTAEFETDNKVNAPTFIYRILNTTSKKFISGSSNHSTKNINGIPIDEGIPTNVMSELNKIKGIQLRSSCQGENPDHPTFLIFRLIQKNNTESVVKQVVDNINSNTGVIAGYDLGNDNQYRIGITSRNMYYGKSGFKEFWNNLPNIIETSI